MQDRKIAAHWAEKLLVQSDWIVLDTETTGLKNPEIIEIAIADSRGKPLLNSLCKPLGTIHADASKCHQLYDADVAEAPNFRDLYPQIAEIFNDHRLLLIYNADFDTRVLRNMCDLHLLPQLKLPAVDCVMRAYAQWVGEWSEKRQTFKWQKLEGGNHRALGDCIATINTIRRMAGLPPEKV
jgi:DNA polymerase III subunit epsilon